MKETIPGTLTKAMRPDQDTLDRMAIDYFMWETFVEGQLRMIADPYVISSTDSAQVKAACENLSALADRTIKLCTENRELLDYFKLSPFLRKMFLTQAHFQGGITRIDCFPTADGWKISEFNSDVPGAINEGAAFHELMTPSKEYHQEPYTAVPMITDSICRQKKRPTIGIIYATGFAEDLEQCQYLRSNWNRQGIPAILGSLGNLAMDGGKFSLFGHKIDVIYRFFPVEWMEGSCNIIKFLSTWTKAKTPVVNPFSQILPQNKKIMAFWHDHMELFSTDERELIRTHVPNTRLFDAQKIGEWISRKDDIVVKRAFGRIGEEVLVGKYYSEEEWREELAWPSSEPDEWIVQERFDVQSVKIGGETMYPCLGVFLVDGRFAGYFTRAAFESFIGYDAFEVPTWIKR